MPALLGPDLGGSQQGEGKAPSEPASALRLCSVQALGSHGGSLSRTHSPTGESPPDQQMPGHSLEFLVSSISVTVERGNTLERQSSVQVLSRLALSVNLFRSADGRFCAQVPVGDRIETCGRKSAAFRDWLIDRLFGNELRRIAPKLLVAWTFRHVRTNTRRTCRHIEVAAQNDELIAKAAGATYEKLRS
jgi:hypothetical protein